MQLQCCVCAHRRGQPLTGSCLPLVGQATFKLCAMTHIYSPHWKRCTFCRCSILQGSQAEADLPKLLKFPVMLRPVHGSDPTGLLQRHLQSPDPTALLSDSARVGNPHPTPLHKTVVHSSLLIPKKKKKKSPATIE